VKSSTQKKIVGAVRKRLDELWGPSPPTVSAAHREIYEGLSKGLKDKVDDATLDSAFRSSAMLAIWADAERSLKDQPEPTAEQLKKILTDIEMVDFDSIVRSLIKRISRKLPPHPPGKRPTLNPQQQAEAFKKVMTLAARGRLNRKQVYEKVAEDYGVHWRTIQNLSTKAQKQLPQRGQL
jgi:hypothetical protein